MKKKYGYWLFFALLIAETANAQWYPIQNFGSVYSFSGATPIGGIFFSGNQLWVTVIPTRPQIVFYSSPDTGRTWITHTLPFNIYAYIWSISFIDKLHGVMVLNSLPSILTTSDGGNTWKFISGGGGWETRMVGSPDTLVWVIEGFISTTHDGGLTWNSITLGNGSRSFAVTPKGTIFAGHDPLMMSTDFGTTWQPTSAKYTLHTIQMDVGKTCDDSTLYFANEFVVPYGPHVQPYDNTIRSQVYVSRDAGKTIQAYMSSKRLGYFNGSIVATKNAAFVSTKDFGIFRTTDRGLTWDGIGGPGGPFDVRSLTAINDTILFAMDSLGTLWKTTNCGGFPIKAPPPPMPQIASTPAKASSCDSGKASASLMHNYCDALTITDASLQGTDASYFTLLPPGLPVSLGNGAKVNFNLNFNPKKEVRFFTAQIHVKGFYIYEYEDTIRIDTLIQVTGTSTPVPPNLITSRFYIPFDTLSTCVPPQDTTVTLTNKGCDTLQIISGPGILAPEFSLVTPLTLPLKLAPDSSITLRFRFKPSGTGLFRTRATFTAEQQTLTQDISINLQGEGEKDVGVLSFAPKKFSFPSISICAHDSASGFVANIGCDSMTLDPTTIFGNSDFQLTVNSLQLTVRPKDTIHYKVYLNPAQKGMRQGYLVLNSNDGLKSRRDTVPFTVTVTDGTRILTTSVNVVDFGKTTLCDQRDSIIHLANTGCDTLQVSGVGGLASGFGTNAKFPIIILPGKDTIIHVFTVLDTIGGKTSNSALLTFTSNSDNTLSPISLTRSYIPSRKIDVGFFLDPAMRSGGDQSIVSYDIKETPGKSFTGAGIKQITFNLNYNTNLLDFQSSKSSGNLSSADGKSFTISGSPEITADANGILASVGFRVYLTKDSTTTIDLVNVKIDTTHAPCTTFAFSASGSATFDYQFLCGERSISGFMKGVMPMKIISMRPNPAQDEIVVDLQSATKQDARIEIRNALGASVYSEAKNLVSGSNSIHLNTKGLAKGIYLIRLWSVKGETSQKFVKIE